LPRPRPRAPVASPSTELGRPRENAPGYAWTRGRGARLTWEHFFVGALLAAWFVRITLWIDPGWKDARTEVRLLDRIVKPFARFGEPIGEALAALEYLWWGFYALTLIACVALGAR
jgi:hypothetical protein